MIVFFVDFTVHNSIIPRFDLSRSWELALGSVKGLKLEPSIPTRARAHEPSPFQFQD